MEQRARVERDKNLIVVNALDGYAHNHGITAQEAARVFRKNDLFSLLRAQYDVLHTLDLDESIAFAEDVLARRGAKQ